MCSPCQAQRLLSSVSCIHIINTGFLRESYKANSDQLKPTLHLGLLKPTTSMIKART